MKQSRVLFIIWTIAFLTLLGLIIIRIHLSYSAGGNTGDESRNDISDQKKYIQFPFLKESPTNKYYQHDSFRLLPISTKGLSIQNKFGFTLKTEEIPIMLSRGEKYKILKYTMVMYLFLIFAVNLV